MSLHVHRYASAPSITFTFKIMRETKVKEKAHDGVMDVFKEMLVLYAYVTIPYKSSVKLARLVPK